MRYLLVPLLLLLLVLPSVVLGQRELTKAESAALDAASDRRVFAGRPGIGFVIFPPSDHPELDFRDEVELTLRRNGVPLLEGKRELDRQCYPVTPNCGTLVVIVDVADMEFPFYVYRVEVRYSEYVILARNFNPATFRFARNNSVMQTAIRWMSEGTLGTVGAKNLSQIRNTVEKEVERFCLAYLRANPPK